MPAVQQQPATLKPYLFHGVDLDWQEGSDHAYGDCPFCGREKKFSVRLDSGLWQCKVCRVGTDKGGGNSLTFLRELHKAALEVEQDYTPLLESRKVLSGETFKAWGVVASPITGDWLVPGYNLDGKLCQLYRYSQQQGKSILLATSSLNAQLYGIDLFDRDCEQVWVTEGPWDAMVLWELLSKVKVNEEGALVRTGNAALSMASKISVLAVPGCGSFQESWAPLFAHREVTLLFDSDHPREHNGRTQLGAGYLGMQRTARILSQSETPPSSIEYLNWGENGYDPDLKSGYDVRDALSGGKDVAARISLLDGLCSRIEAVPEDWTQASRGSGKGESSKEGKELQSVPCSSWRELTNAWRKALLWRQGLEDVLAVMLAVTLSTDQVGDQLFFMVIGDPGSGKTRLCDALLVSKHCYALEHITGFHSGWKGNDGDEDFSLLARINRKTLITPEGDVMMSSPKFVEIMSQQRRIFDGTSGASFKNRKEDMRYTGLRTPWIMAGTAALMETDQARMGDRFLRICVDRPSEEDRRAILRRVGYTALQSVVQQSNGQAISQLPEKLTTAYQLTGGYVDWLRSDPSELLSGVQVEEEEIVDRLSDLAEFTAFLRARPNPDSKKESEAAKELPSRLMHQYVRLACCLAVVYNKRTVDKEVLRVVHKVALDTSRGRTQEIARHLAPTGNIGMEVRELSYLTKDTEEHLRKLLRFLHKIDAADHHRPEVKGLKANVRWRLTPRMLSLWQAVMS